MFRKTLYSEDRFEIVADMDRSFVQLHCEVMKWSKDCLLDIRKVWEMICEALWYEGFDEVYAITPSPKFIKLIGQPEYVGMHGGQEVYRWELNSPSGSEQQ